MKVIIVLGWVEQSHLIRIGDQQHTVAQRQTRRLIRHGLRRRARQQREHCRVGSRVERSNARAIGTGRREAKVKDARRIRALRVLIHAGGNVGDVCERLRVGVDRKDGIVRIDHKQRAGGSVEKQRTVLGEEFPKRKHS